MMSAVPRTPSTPGRDRATDRRSSSRWVRHRQPVAAAGAQEAAGRVVGRDQHQATGAAGQRAGAFASVRHLRHQAGLVGPHLDQVCQTNAHDTLPRISSSFVRGRHRVGAAAIRPATTAPAALANRSIRSRVPSGQQARHSAPC